MEKVKTEGLLRKILPAFVFFAAAALFLFRRARYGYCYQDEPFLVSLAARILRGDTLLLDEWNGAQNTGVLLLPVYALMHRLLGGTEGILLAMRWAYCAFWLAALVFLCVLPQIETLTSTFREWAELSGMPETRVVTMYYVATAALCLLALLGFVA